VIVVLGFKQIRRWSAMARQQRHKSLYEIQRDITVCCVLLRQRVLVLRQRSSDDPPL
jgi:hypothetical protein